MLSSVAVAPITIRVRGLDNIQTIPFAALGRVVGVFYPDQETALTEPILAAFDLE